MQNPHVLTALLYSSVGTALKNEWREDLMQYISAVALGKPGVLVISTTSTLARAEIKLLTTPILEGVVRTLSRFEKTEPLTRLAFREWNGNY